MKWCCAPSWYAVRLRLLKTVRECLVENSASEKSECSAPDVRMPARCDAKRGESTYNYYLG
jgi:hypothetical protein